MEAEPDMLIETTIKHTGLPVRAESRVTLIGSMPKIGVVGISTWTRRLPVIVSVRRVIVWKEIGVFPADPIRAT